jgi:aldose 1-epimerase
MTKDLGGARRGEVNGTHKGGHEFEKMMGLNTLRLVSGDWEAEVSPALGGSALSLRHAGDDVLRPPTATMTSALDSACFPLVPYANRIAHGRFRFADEIVELPRNFGEHPHSLHGVGWLVPWRITHRSDAEVALAHTHDGGGAWPWRYDCVQHLSLDESGLSATLTLGNRDVRPMPAGLGFHPYLAARPGDRLTFRCTETWLTDDTQLATHAGAADAIADWRRGADVFRPGLVDHCHGVWNGTVSSSAERGPSACQPRAHRSSTSISRRAGGMSASSR